VETALLNSPHCKIVSVADRTALLRELEFAQSGFVGPESANQLKYLIGPEKLLVVQEKGVARTIRMVDKETGLVEAALLSGDGPAGDSHAALVKSLYKLVEGRAVIRALKKLQPGANQITVRIESEQRRFRVGEPFRFSIHSSRSGFLTLFDIQPDGTFLPFVPNKFGLSNRIEAGTPYVFPNNGLTVTVAPPTGVDTVFAVVTANPLQLPADGLVLEDQHMVYEPGRGADAARGFQVGMSVLPAGDWGVARMEITTEPR